MLFQSASGLRTRPISATLALARAVGAAYGVRRAFEITRLDRIGWPVFAAVRPNARTVCVNNGKGDTADEAEVSARMAAIELTVAEEHYRPDAISSITPQAYRKATGGRVVDFCPILGRAIPLDRPMPCCMADDVETGVAVPVPAEVIVHPDHLRLDAAFLGWTTAGLASGNSEIEASVHALCEVMERDVESIDALDGNSALVPPESLCPSLRELDQAVRAAGLRAWLRWVPNVFEIPYFRYVVVDPDCDSLCFANGGFGAHPNARVAARRAMQEAIQSRAAMIHGGREDLEEYVAFEASLSVEERRQYLADIEASHQSASRVVGLDQVPCRAVGEDLVQQFGDLVDCVRRAGLGPVLRYRYTRPDEALQILRIIVPGAENFTRSTSKVGVRLHEALRRRKVAS